MKRAVVFFISVLAFCSLRAQNANLNPTVRVTNEYSGKALDADREAMVIEVPDSMYHFNLRFDYAGFEKQYRGNDEFNPDYTELLMSERKMPYRKFYMKAGAGYTVHPVFDLAWAVNPEDRFKVGVFASHKSYFGIYDKCLNNPSLEGEESSFRGYDSKSAAGIDARADWEKLFLSMRISYDGIHSAERFRGEDNTGGFNSASASVRLKSNSIDGVSSWKYDVAARYSYSAYSGIAAYVSTPVSPAEHDAGYDAEVATMFGSSSIELLSSGDFVYGRSGDAYNGYSVSFKPRYVFNDGGLSLGIGLCLLYSGGNNVVGTLNAKGENERFSLWPSLELRWRPLPGKFELFADADMYSALFGMREKIMKYHFNLFEANRCFTKTSNIDFGFRGDIGEMVKWKLCAAYEYIQNADVPLVALVGGNVPLPTLSLLHENSLEDFNFSLDLKIRPGSFYFDGNVRYAMYLNKAATPIMPSPLTAKAEMGYAFLKKADIFVGADYRSSYSINAGECGGLTFPGYDVPDLINLYAGARVSVYNGVSLFVEGGNLLNRSCQYISGISERGFSITGGVVLNF